MPLQELHNSFRIAIGIVKAVKRESLPIARLWRESEQGQLARVSREQFNAYYANQKAGIGIWVGAAKLLPIPIALSQLRKNWGQRWQPPQQIQQLTSEQMETALNIGHAHIARSPTERYVVMDDLTAWRGQMLDTLDIVNPISRTNN